MNPTPGQTIGPFYGYALPYPGDHELVPPDHPAAIRLHGTVFDGGGAPVPDALLEIRQAGPDGAVPTVDGSIRRDGTRFTGWGRCGTDQDGHYAFTTVEPGPAAPFFAVVVFARGLLDRLFTRAYLAADAPFLAALDARERATLVAVREPGGDRRFDIHLQGERQTTFLSFPRHGTHR
ncbi:protocatechuate 3,4-dioxygenase subunit alpha [Dactylosporangium aurantiacum]|uniref:Protocatechuate 3,4-dioxygenase subunit alpha n=1 Tax=Dactylosporangium aurantiacum TaxID=35754 RepID=A0A9Q9IA59_9ACTN|nr:protocatechuate 3,4-dioxygenase subunit alpha [Dactylosporangium aurantiacum]MDG6107236.1 protocatechuate 3,4-dioxygenase subunit alpha [Dactylosporangium aurantiacum]UWZ51231.1 protocatechuate 3,4-dioxygenase subunit alpha [Dactylosporangium aurantiacum]